MGRLIAGVLALVVGGMCAGSSWVGWLFTVVFALAVVVAATPKVRFSRR